jgi:large subunit ribosomal protein L13
MVKEQKTSEKWYIVDADNVVLGRLAVAVSRVLSGKHKPTYRRDLNMGDGVVVVNAAKIKVTGKKPVEKNMTGIPGIREEGRRRNWSRFLRGNRSML